MNLNGLVSNYTIKKFKIQKSNGNNDLIDNTLNKSDKLEVVVSDLTYVNVTGKWELYLYNIGLV